MFHTNTQKLIEDWQARRGDRHAPARSDIAPGAYRELLPQLFILGREAGQAEVFRLAGGLLSDLHDRDLRGIDFFSLFRPSDRDRARAVLAEARRDGAPAVLKASAWAAEGEEMRLEIVMAPLVGPSGEMDRVIGLYQPTSSVRRLLGKPVVRLTLHESRLVEDAPDRPVAAPPAAAPARDAFRLRLVAIDGQRLD